LQDTAPGAAASSTTTSSTLAVSARAAGPVIFPFDVALVSLRNTRHTAGQLVSSRWVWEFCFGLIKHKPGVFRSPLDQLILLTAKSRRSKISSGVCAGEHGMQSMYKV
jgi:hypothetical protein